MQHGEYGGRPDTGTEQDDGSIVGSQNKTTPRCAYLQSIARMYMVVKIGAGNPLRLSFDADPIGLGARAGDVTPAKQPLRALPF